MPNQQLPRHPPRLTKITPTLKIRRRLQSPIEKQAPIEEVDEGNRREIIRAKFKPCVEHTHQVN